MVVKDVVGGRGGRRGGRRMRVRATGSSGVTTVNAVQTTVKGQGARGERPEGEVRPGRGQVKRINSNRS